MSVTHSKTNNITDWTQAQLDAQIALGNFPAGTVLADIVLPSDWNNSHTVSIDVSEINATGSPSSSNFLRGDGSWNSPAGAGTVTTTGSPASGNLTKFSGGTSIVNGDLSGDVTTSGTLAATVAKIQGTTVSGTTGSGNVVFSTSPTLNNISLSDNTNQLVLGTTNTGTVTMAVLSAPRTWTYPNNTGTVVLLSNSATIQNKTFDSTNTWNGAKIGLAFGGTNADLSATGAAHNFLKQSSSGAAITVGQPATTDLSDIGTFNLSTSGTGSLGGALNMNSHLINNVTDPSGAQDAATKNYVDAGTTTLTNKRITKRVITAADATSVTPNSDNADITYQANTQTAGTLTINADGGTATNGQAWLLKLKCTNAQTFSWNAIFKGGTVALPTTTTGGGKIDYYSFIYDTVTPAWMFTGNALGF